MSSYALNIDQIFDDFIAENQKAWAHDRSSTVGASEVFDCLRKVWFGKVGTQFGFEPDADYKESWGAMERGNIIENHHVVPAMTHHLPDGLELLFQGENQQTLVKGKSSATPDGLIVGLPRDCELSVVCGGQTITIPNIKSDCVNFEIKSIDPRATLLEERAKHRGQTHVQIGLIHELTEWRPFYSIILYVDASFLDNKSAFVVEYDPDVFEAAKMRASQIWDVKDPMMIMPEGRFDDACKHCKWKTACTQAVIDAIPEHETTNLDTVELECLTNAVNDYRRLQEAAKKAEEAFKISQEHIREILMDFDVRKVIADGYRVTWSRTKGKRALDQEAMRADGIDPDDYMREGRPYDRLTVTFSKEKSSG